MFANWGIGNRRQPEQAASTNSQMFGVKLPDDNKVAKIELNALAKKYAERSKKIDDHIKKATKERELANKLAASFIHNYNVMIDISSLLNQYAEFFQQIKDLLMKSDSQLEQLNAQNFQNLERLTRQEMDRFTSKFTEQAEKVRKLFVTYNMNDQAAKLGTIPQMTSDVSTAAENVLRATPPKYGGQKHLRKALKNGGNGRQQKKKGSQA